MNLAVVVILIICLAAVIRFGHYETDLRHLGAHILHDIKLLHLF
jgi:hypothetical protein